MRIVFATCLLAWLTGCGATPKEQWQDWLPQRGEVSATPRADHVASIGKATPATLPLVLAEPYKIGDGAATGPGHDLAMRNPDFPRTHIAAVIVDLTAPDRWVSLQWSGPDAADAPIGPWRCTPGRGSEGFDCNDVKDSNTVDSFCTPKGVFPVAGFADHLRLTPTCRYATWVLHAPRFIAMHSHADLPREAVSSGCIRLPYEAAKLIHNNSIVGLTLINIGGTWERSGSASEIRSAP